MTFRCGRDPYAVIEVWTIPRPFCPSLLTCLWITNIINHWYWPNHCQVGNCRRQTQTIEGTVHPRFERTFLLWAELCLFHNLKVIRIVSFSHSLKKLDLMDSHWQWSGRHVGGRSGFHFWRKQQHRGRKLASWEGECLLVKKSDWNPFSHYLIMSK